MHAPVAKKSFPTPRHEIRPVRSTARTDRSSRTVDGGCGKHRVRMTVPPVQQRGITVSYSHSEFVFLVPQVEGFSRYEVVGGYQEWLLELLFDRQDFCSQSRVCK